MQENSNCRVEKATNAVVRSFKTIRTSTVRRQRILIVRIGQRMSIAPPCSKILEALATKVLRPVNDDRHGCRIGVVTAPLLLPAEPPQPPCTVQQRTIATAGLEPVILYKAQEAGYDAIVCWDGPRPARLPQPNLGASRWAGQCDEHVLRFIHDHDRGLVRFIPGKVDVLCLIVQIALAFSTATMIVTMATNEVARKVYDRLTKSLAGVTIVTSKRCPPAPGRICVCTFAALARTEIECEKRDIVIAMDAAELIGERGQEAVLMADARFRLFGFLPIGRKLSRYDYDRLVAMFGLQETFVPRHGHQPIQVTVAWSPIRAPALPRDLGLLTLKRRGIWKQQQRNRQVARLAAALADGNWKLLCGKHPAIAEAIDTEGPHRVAVVVEALEHALELASRLPHWPVKAGTEVVERGLPPRLCRLLAARRVGRRTTSPFIATSAALEEVEFTELDVVIWAGGGPYGPPLPADRLICRASKEHRLLVVDSCDRHHPRLRRWSRRRREAYREAGWFAPGANPLAEKIKRFLADRPRRTP